MIAHIELNTQRKNPDFAAIKARKARKRCKEEYISYMKQKLSGIAMIATGATASFVCGEDLGWAFIIASIGVYLTFTKQIIMEF